MSEYQQCLLVMRSDNTEKLKREFSSFTFCGVLRPSQLREEGRRRRGRPRLRWEDCVKRDARKAGEEENWKKTRDRGGWKRLSNEVVKKSRAAPHT